MDHAAFFSEAWKAIARALAEAGVKADLDQRPDLIRKSVKRRCLAELKRLAILLRRLIFLMALGLELAPAAPRRRKNYFETEKAPAPKPCSFALAPAPAGPCPHFLRGPDFVPSRGPVPAAPIIARWRAMLLALKHRERRAKCLARTLRRWQANGEPKPHILPIARPHRMPAHLGLVSGALVVRLTEALRRWPDTG